MITGENLQKGITYCMVKLPASMVAWGSEFLFNRLMTIFAFVFGSDSSASDCNMLIGISPSGGVFKRNPYLFIIYRSCKHQA